MTEERTCRRNGSELGMEVKLPECTQKSRDRDPRWRPLSLGLQGPPGQDLLCTLLEGEDRWIERNG